jgi:hypothetical protein
VVDFTRRKLNRRQKEGGTVDADTGNSQPNKVLAGYPQTVAVKRAWFTEGQQ